MERIDVERALRRANPEEVRSLTRADTDRYLLEALETEAGAFPRTNVDRLMGMGVQLARSGFGESDDTALTWLNEQLAEPRLDAVSGFLAGFWKKVFHTPPIPPERIEALLTANEAIRPQSGDTGFMVLQAIAAAAREDTPAAVRERIRTIFERALRQKQPPHIVPMLRSLAGHVFEAVGP